MAIKSTFTLPLAVVLAAAVSASPADAQGRGNGNGKKDRVEQQERRRDLDRDDRRDDRRAESRVIRRDRDGDRWVLSGDRRVLTRNGKRVPPGWCQGRGNPHNTPANCGGYTFNTRRSVWDWIGLGDRDRRSDDRRHDDRTRRSSGSHAESHADFHRVHDARCRDRTDRAGSLAERIRIAADCKAEHDAWHRRTGTRH